MNVLSIGTDKKLFDPHSQVSTRARAYGNRVSHVHSIVFTLASEVYIQYDLSEHVTVYPTQSTSRFAALFDAIRIGKKIIKENKFVRGDSVITSQDPFESGFVAFRIASAFRLPLHIQIHTDFLSPYFVTSFFQRIRAYTARFLLPRASGIRVVSSRIAQSIISSGIRLSCQPQVLPIRINIPEEQMQVVGSRNEKSHGRLFPEFQFALLMVCRLEKEKRIEDALQMFKRIHELYPYTGLVIAGDGTQATRLETYAHTLGIGSAVKFLGFVDDVPSVISSADIFISTSEYEGYGMSLVEAGLLGCPIVTTDVGVARDVLIDGRNAYICPVGDVECLTRKTIDLLTHNEQRSLFSMNLRHDIVGTLPTYESYVDMYIKGLVDTAHNI